MSLSYVLSSNDLAGNTRNVRYASCPAGRFLVGGGCGHRDYNAAAKDVVINYSGPAPENPRGSWRCIAENTSGDSRAFITYAICSSATAVTGP